MDLLLNLVWDKTASGTARNKTENKHSISLPMLLLAVPEAILSHTKTRSRSAVQSIFCAAPRCPGGSLVPYKSEENQFHPVLAFLGTGAPMLLSTGPTPSSLEFRHVPVINPLHHYRLYLPAKGQGLRTVNIVVNSVWSYNYLSLKPGQ